MDGITSNVLVVALSGLVVCLGLVLADLLNERRERRDKLERLYRSERMKWGKR